MATSAPAEATRGDSALASGKRRAFRSVQEAREKLTYKSGFRPEFEYELLMMFVRNALSGAATTPLLAVIVAFRRHVLGAAARAHHLARNRVRFEGHPRRALPAIRPDAAG